MESLPGVQIVILARPGAFAQRLLRRSFFSHFPTLRKQLSPRRSRALPTPPLPCQGSLACGVPLRGLSAARRADPPWLPYHPFPCFFRPTGSTHPLLSAPSLVHSLATIPQPRLDSLLLLRFPMLCFCLSFFLFCFSLRFAFCFCFFLHAFVASHATHDFSLHVFALILYREVRI